MRVLNFQRAEPRTGMPEWLKAQVRELAAKQHAEAAAEKKAKRQAAEAAEAERMRRAQEGGAR